MNKNGKNVLTVVDVVSNEKNVEREIIFQAIEAALASATKKRYPDDIDVRVTIDRQTGEYETYRRWMVVDDEDPEFESPVRQTLYSRAVADHPEIQVGDYVEAQLENEEFGRIAAQAAKQVIVQKVREAERAQVVEAYEERVGELITGVVKRMERGAVIVDLGGITEAIIPRDHLIPREPLRVGDRVRGYLYEVSPQQRGPQLFLSRTAPEFLLELFKLEVPEIAQGLIELRGAARDPGLRAKIAVQAKDKRIDPVGACVGMRGSRVQSVSNELAGERVDIVPWDDNVAQFVINAMAPAEVESIVVDEDARSMIIAVDEERLAQAIGRGGQNVRLASELTGWTLNVMTSEQAAAKTEEENTALRNMFMESLGVDEEVADILVQEGFTSLEEIAYVPEQELIAIEEFDEAIVEELRTRARDALLANAISGGGDGPADDLFEVEGMTDELAQALAAQGIRTRDDLADLGSDELSELVGIEEDAAGEIIMAARAHWFAE
ncbi:transcription termination factor NusA [Algiphilus sp.]|uniref:transcription termination factor NusA n=1 Tax=Algiphilus sp. TaxID=1872431 RepID=UPI001CA694FD|nr:transcription termination factor NusA [Algiphilus sp.]MBY8966484.1 transcription termination/antitermination protein NusA [Algiphilus acroporae]MCI5062080.1 transcription termination factor NusA [Algiphilus sp.]MCI5103496.1 transcription termination factor NusA [Algiphilus sp.]MCR9091296.1 transcription termination factor NusA [Pseudomonadota bacterium]